MDFNKHDINAFSPEELREIYIEMYAETFERDKESAREMFLSMYSEDHDFHTYAKVEYAIKDHARLCGV